MYGIVSGLGLVAASFTGFWYFLPRNGIVHPLAKKPFFDSFITIAIMTVFALGATLVGAGLYE
jgi:hypothetical protein